MLAEGRKAWGHCDRCGFRYYLWQLNNEWNGLKVCRSCFEDKHPQLRPTRKAKDPTALKDPRPNNDNDGGVTVGEQSAFGLGGYQLTYPATFGIPS